MPHYGTIRVDWDKREFGYEGMCPHVSELTRLGVLRFLLEPNPKNEERKAIVYYEDDAQMEFYGAEQLLEITVNPIDLVVMVDLWLEINRSGQDSARGATYRQVQDLRVLLDETSRVPGEDTAEQKLLIEVLAHCFAVQPPDSPAAREARLLEMGGTDLRDELEILDDKELEALGIVCFHTSFCGTDEMRDVLRKVWTARDATDKGRSAAQRAKEKGSRMQMPLWDDE